MMKEMKKIARCLLLLSGLLWTVAVQADDFGYSSGASGEVTVSSYSGTAADVVIPDEVNYGGKTCRITAINSYVFNQCSTVQTLRLGKYVRSIGYNAFNDCKNLTSVTWNDSLRVIGQSAFSG